MPRGMRLAQLATRRIKKPEKSEMKLTLALLTLLLASLMGCTAMPDRVLYYREYAGYGNCHMKIETAGDPFMPTEREVVDYYGPCDAKP
jgi:hypothetical protein